MTNSNLQGLGVAIVTPFNKDKSIDFPALESLLEFIIKGNVDFIVVLGTTAETPTLSNTEKISIRQFVKDKVNGRLPLVLGYGSNNTQEIIDSLKSDDLTGYSAILSVVPFYNKPTQEGIYQHFRAIAEASPIPVILYNVPGRTGANVTAATTIRLANDCRNIIGIKEASGDFSQIQEILDNKPKDFIVLSGDDGNTFPLINMGCAGVISVIGNAFPSEFGKMVKLALNGNRTEAGKIHEKFTRLFELLFKDGNPAGVKCSLHELGLIENVLRLPLVPTSLSTNEEIHEVIKQINN